MAKIIDTHSHILPGIDDGAGSWKEALCMLKTAQAQGIRRVIATPHWGGPFGYTDPVQIRELCFTLQEKARRHNISVKIYQGQEVMYTEEAADRIANGEILTLADSRYVLAEFYQGIGYSGIFRAVQRFTQSGYSPIIAHAERYEALKDIGRLEELRKQGALNSPVPPYLPIYLSDQPAGKYAYKCKKHLLQFPSLRQFYRSFI